MRILTYYFAMNISLAYSADCGCYRYGVGSWIVKKRNLLYIGNRLVSILTIVDQKKVPSL